MDKNKNADLNMQDENNEAEIFEETVQTEPNLEQILNETKDKYLRLMAEFENFKKRTAQEKSDITINAISDTVLAILPVIDNFDRALGTCGDTDNDVFADGMKLVYKQLTDALDKLGVKAIESVGAVFNPDLHNAVQHIEDEEYDENIIVEEFMRGYMIGSKVVRHAMVKVAN